MCGIAGFWRLAGPRAGDGERLGRMADSLAHRGPDDFGYLLATATGGQTQIGQKLQADFQPEVFLAGRRLAILDLTAAGRQPVANETGDVVVVFNGAIHNYIELRAQLQARGHVFRTQTDTEVIVHAYEEWGPECARRFNGMWAYAIWDRRQRQLVCSRDRFGIKPFVFAREGGTFFFASEAKAILATGEVQAVADQAFVRRFLLSDLPVNGNGTAFEGIEQLPPGHNLVVTQRGRQLMPYWTYADRSCDYDYDNPEQTFRELLTRALQIRLRSDVPIALLLSGGLDSSTLAALVAGEESARERQALTFVFPGFKSDEREYSKAVAALNGLQLHFVEYDPSRLPGDLSAVAWHMDAPPSRGSTLARWQLFEAVSHYGPIVLEGQGADEMLGGYPGVYRRPYLRSERARLSGSNFRRIAPRLWSAFWRLSPPHFSSLPRALGARTARDPSQFCILSRDLKQQAAKPEAVDLRSATPFFDPLTQQLMQDHAHAILPHLLHFGDALSMAHSVESRLPFLDHRLVEFVFGLPFDEKIRGAQTKYLLRRTFGAQMPPQVLARRDKVGFDTPLRQWLQASFERELKPRLASPQIGERGYVDGDALRQCIKEFQAGHNEATRPLFRALALEAWCERFL